MDTLSARAQQLYTGDSALVHNYMLVIQNQYDEEKNPNGICNLGVAENYLCETELVDKLKSIQTWETNYNYYPDSMGQINLRKVLCNFFEDVFHINTQLDPNRMLISSGISGAISLLSYLIADPNDIFLMPSPYYTAFDDDISIWSHNAIVRCPLLEQDSGKFRFTVEVFESGYDESVKNGLRPRAIIIVNPQNPLGDVYDSNTVRPVLEFAAKKQLHVIIDEIYALSLFNNQAPFESMLNYSSIPDPARTHFLCSFSKDFTLSGTRIGVLYGGSNDICLIGAKLNFMSVPSIVVQETLAALLADRKWTHFFIELNRSRLTKEFQRVKHKLEEIDDRIHVRPSHAGLFLWIDLRLLMNQVTFDEELYLFQHILDNGVYVSGGASLGCSQPGWFRLIFTVKKKWIDEGLKRLKMALDTYRLSYTSC